MKKIRLDQLLAQRYPQFSRRQIQSWIMQDKVRHENSLLNKAGMMVPEDIELVCDFQEPKFVSRAGFKLEKALDHFGVDVAGLTVLDAGISTGGFTHCLLQRGIKKVYGVDVGYGDVHDKVRRDERVQLLERTNLRLLETVGDPVDLITLDLSFISVTKVLDAIKSLLKPDGAVIVLIKPQFEARRDQIGKGGIVKDPAVHQEVISKIQHAFEEAGFDMIGVTESPIEGATGNKEFLAYFKRRS